MALPKVETPRYELQIPSNGKMVTYRPYLVKEEKVLMVAMESQDNRQMIRAVKDVISTCTDGEVDISKLTMFDLEYVFAMLRAKSVGETTTVGVKCDSCESKNDVDVSLEDVRVNVPKDDGDKTIHLTDDIGVVLRYPSVDALIESEKPGTSDIDTVFALATACIDSIFSGDDVYDVDQQSKKDMNEFIESLSTEQFNRIREFAEGMPTAALDIHFKCTNCGEDNNVEVKGLANFFS